LVTNIVKEEFKDIESHDGGSLNLRLYGIPSRQEKDFTGQGGDFFLTFGFKEMSFVDSWLPILAFVSGIPRDSVRSLRKSVAVKL
jgi:hypothetical protein